MMRKRGDRQKIRNGPSIIRPLFFASCPYKNKGKCVDARLKKGRRLQ